MNRPCKMCSLDAFGVKTGSCPLKCERALLAFLDASDDRPEVDIDLSKALSFKEAKWWENHDALAGTWLGFWAAARRQVDGDLGVPCTWYVKDLRFARGKQWGEIKDRIGRQHVHTLGIEVLLDGTWEGYQRPEWIPATLYIFSLGDPRSIRI